MRYHACRVEDIHVVTLGADREKYYIVNKSL